VDLLLSPPHPSLYRTRVSLACLFFFFCTPVLCPEAVLVQPTTVWVEQQQRRLVHERSRWGDTHFKNKRKIKIVA
jgi:hypothetical protein